MLMRQSQDLSGLEAMLGEGGLIPLCSEERFAPPNPLTSRQCALQVIHYTPSGHIAGRQQCVPDFSSQHFPPACKTEGMKPV